MRGRRAFSLVEILISISVLGLVLGIGVVSLNHSTRQASSNGMAELLADELRAARQRAIARDIPVALSFSSQAGTTPISSSVTWLEGESDPRVIRVRNFERESAFTRFFVGRWAGQPDTLDAPNQASFPAIKMSQWFSAAPPRDYLAVFRPDGNLMTNDWPLYQGKYHLVVCQGCSFTPCGPPPGTASLPGAGPAYFQLDRVAEPHTICMEPSGAITVESGVPGASSALVVVKGSQDTPSSPPLLSSFSNALPQVTSVTLLPQPPTTPPAGVQTIVSPSDYVELEVVARDPEGDPLFCRWTSSGGSFSGGTPGGTVPTRMRYDPNSKTYKSTWTFHADPRDADLTHYQLTCQVKDEHGGVATAAGGVLLNYQFELRKQKRYVVSGPSSSPAGFKLYSVNEDGSDFRVIPNAQAMPWIMPNVTVSPDGNKIAYAAVIGARLRVINIDGSDDHALQVGIPGSFPSFPCFDPDGTHVVYEHNGNGVWVSPLDGGAPVQLAPAPYGWPVYNADGSKLLLRRNNDTLCVMDLANPAHPITPLYTAPSGNSVAFPQFYKGPFGTGANDDLVMYQLGNDTTMTGGGGPIYTLRLSSPTPQPTGMGGGEAYLSWSSDGRHVGYLVNALGAEMHVAEFDIGTNSMVPGTDHSVTPSGVNCLAIHL